MNECKWLDCIDLQWFGDGEKNQIEFEEPEVEEVEVIVPGRDEIPIVENNEPEEFKESKREELIALVEKERLAKEALIAKADSVSAITQGLSSLNDNLTKPRPVVQQKQQKPFDKEQFTEEITSGIIENPLGTLDKYFATKIAPELQSLQMNNLVHSKNYARLNPETKEYLDKYGPEIEAEVGRRLPWEKTKNPHIYAECINTVVAKHINEIRQEAVAQALKQQQEQTVTTAKPKAFTEQSVRPAVKAKKIVMTPEDMRQADIRGINYDDYGRYVKNAK